jgi:hypothetical protein
MRTIMRQIIPIAILLFVFQTGLAQRATLKGDSLYYGTHKVYKGKKLTFNYGSAPDKSFVFVYFGSRWNGLSKVNANAAKMEAVVDEIIVKGRLQRWIRARPTVDGAMLGNRFWINVEGALDHNEITLLE